jgi:hypothetical protein
MIDDMRLKGLSASTQEGYVNAVRGIARHYHRSPDELSEEDLRQYFLYLANEKKVARSTATVAICEGKGTVTSVPSTEREDTGDCPPPVTRESRCPPLAVWTPTGAICEFTVDG